VPVENRFDNVIETGLEFEFFDVLNRPGAQIVDNRNRVPLIQESFGEMGPNESRASRDQVVHLLASPFSN
jgi:hypothetical protein